MTNNGFHRSVDSGPFARCPNHYVLDRASSKWVSVSVPPLGGFKFTPHFDWKRWRQLVFKYGSEAGSLACWSEPFASTQSLTKPALLALGDFAGRIFIRLDEKSLALCSANFGSCSPTILVLTSFEWRSLGELFLQERPLYCVRDHVFRGAIRLISEWT